jgi:hypothetical protein
MLNKLGVAVTTHAPHRRFLKPALESCKAIGSSYIVCSYNVDGKFTTNTIDRLLPSHDIMDLTDRWVISLMPGSIGSWAELHQQGVASVLKMGYEYIFTSEGDCILQKPEGVQTLLQRLIDEEGDILPCECAGEGHCGCVSYVAKTKSAMAMIDNLLENRNNPNLLGAGPEGRFGAAAKELNMKVLRVINPATSHFSYEHRGTWGDVLGFIHVHGTEKWRLGNHRKPLPKSFYDTRYLWGGELSALEHYWSTGDVSKFVEVGYWPKEPVHDTTAIPQEEI